MHSRLKFSASLVLTIALAAGLALTLNTQEVRGIDLTSSRLLKFEPGADLGGESCTWEVASALDAPRPGYQGAGAAVRGEPADSPRRAAVAEAKPVRFIQDPYPGFLALTVDPIRDEVVAMDGNRFNFLVYDRTVSTPDAAEFTPPKRQFRAPETAWYMSDVHVDPKTGDIYAVNNDSMRGMNTFFANNQQGHVKTNRHLNIPYGTYGMDIDDETGDTFLTIQHDGAIVVWPKTAKDGDWPTRLIQGDKTHLGDPHHVALDKKNGLLWVVNYGTSRNSIAGTLGSAESKERPRIPNWPSGNLFIQPNAERPGYRFEIVLGSGKFGPPSVTAFPENGQGNISPVREIVGPKTGLSWPTGVARDPATGEIWVANAIGDTISVFASDANGDVAPVRVIRGPKTLLKNPSSVAIDAAHDEVWVANYGSHTAVAFKRSSKGDVAPARVIRSAPLSATRPIISNPFAAAYDSRRGDIIVPNCVSHPRISVFDSMADKSDLPKRAIEGQRTHLNRTVHSVAYDDVNDEIVVQSNIGQAILFFRGGANGDEAPVRVIQGPSTRLRDPEKVSIDGVHNEVFAYNMTIYNEILVFDSKKSGDQAPKRVLSGGDKYRFGNLFVDTTRDLLIVSGAERGPGGGARLFVFDRKASGTAEPLRKINAPAGAIRVVPKTGKIAVTVGGADDADATADESGERKSNAHVAIYDINDNGAVQPEWTVGRGKLMDIRGLALDTRNKTVVISDKGLQGVLTFSLPEIF